MATGPNSDVIPVRKETKRRLDAVRGGETYDAVVRRLVDLAGDRVEPSAPTRSPPRDPEEQLLIARLAVERWRSWRETGRIRDLGPCLVEYHPSVATPEVRYVVSRRRGLAP